MPASATSRGWSSAGRARTARWWQRLLGVFREPVADRLLDDATDFEITVVTPHARIERRKAVARRAPARRTWRGYADSAWPRSRWRRWLAWPISIWDAVPGGAISALYLVAVLMVGARWGLGPVAGGRRARLARL